MKYYIKQIRDLIDELCIDETPLFFKSRMYDILKNMEELLEEK